MLSLTQVLSKARSGNRISSGSSAEETSRDILWRVFGNTSPHGVGFRLWDGSTWPEAPATAPVATVVLNRPSALREMLFSGTETGLGEAYLASAFDIEGDMEAACKLADVIIDQTNGWTKKLDLGRLLFLLPGKDSQGERSQGRASLTGGAHSLERDLKAVDFHYNVSNDFYALWLGRQMAYSCAYFEKADDDLETAQDKKFDYICRKLGLRAGDRLLDVGCGWGGLIMHAARNYGAQAHGITLSTEQLQMARQRIRESGLSNSVSVELRDYRELPGEEAYDAVTSVGMVEHVGRKNLPTYFRKILSLLRPGGLFLNHGIGLGPVRFPGKCGSFIQDYVFPDSDLLQIGEMTTNAEREGWAVRDIENLRLHYARTLREWLKCLALRREEALRYTSPRIYRTWLLYMAGCAHNFQTARLAVYQSLLAKVDAQGSSRAPLVRSVWYQ